MDNIRSFERIHFHSDVTLEFEDARFVCELVDISLHGALLHNCTGATPAVGTPCKLILELNEETRITMEGSVAHKNANRIGIICLSIDLSSMTHLRKLVEVNHSDPSLLEREIHALFT